MKLLLAVQAKNTKAAETTLAWTGRAGYSQRLFVPKGKAELYLKVIEDVNHNNYLDLKYEMIVERTDPMNYADQHGYDLVCIVPAGLTGWTKTTNDKDFEKFLVAISKARLAFSKHKKLMQKKFTNGATMDRVL